jgi:hypothetical protein
MTHRSTGEIAAESGEKGAWSDAEPASFVHRTGGDGRGGLPLLSLLLVLALIASAFAILTDSGVVPAWPMDQSFAQVADLRIGKANGSWVFHYPNLQNSGAITSSLIAGIYKLIVPTTVDTLNWHIRILAMSMYLVSGYMLILAFLRRTSVRLAALLLIVVSGYQFVEPSSELFAAALLGWFLVAAVHRLPVWLVSLLLVGYGLCKVELILSCLLLGALWCWFERRDKRKRLLIPIGVAGWLALFLLPSIRVHGKDVLSGSRSWEAFKVKYTQLFHRHQINPPGKNAWAYSHKTIDKVFPGNDQKIINVIRNYPRAYLDYFMLASVQSVLNVMNGAKFLLVPALLFFTAPKVSSPRLRFAVGALLIVVVFALAPAMFMGFIHVRYVMRYFPLIVVVLLGVFLDDRQDRAWIRPLVWASAIVTLIMQLIWLPKVFSQAHFL